LRIDAINTVFKADVPAESLTCISSWKLIAIYI
jgi:hypothetical protein